MRLPGKGQKFKVRLVAKGFTQEQGVDYKAKFSPVANGVSFRLSLALVVRYNLQLRQIDVETAFPYADLEEDVYMSPPAGIDIPKGCCYMLDHITDNLRAYAHVFFHMH